jgi:hypothetical protein
VSLPELDRVLGPLARSRADELAYYLASIVESSDDAIITNDLNGVRITDAGQQALAKMSK